MHRSQCRSRETALETFNYHETSHFILAPIFLLFLQAIYACQYKWTFFITLFKCLLRDSPNRQFPPLLCLSSCAGAVAGKAVPCGPWAKSLGLLNLWRYLMVEEDHELSWEDSLGSQHHGDIAGLQCHHTPTKGPRGPQGLDPGVSPSPNTHPHSEELSDF